MGDVLPQTDEVRCILLSVPLWNRLRDRCASGSDLVLWIALKTRIETLVRLQASEYIREHVDNGNLGLVLRRRCVRMQVMQLQQMRAIRYL